MTLQERLRAAGYDERLSTGALYLEAAVELDRLNLLNSSLTDKSNAYLAENARLERENEALRKCVSFFSSVIKSGEPWTQECQDALDKVKEQKPCGS